jgi:hypothetical protein
MPPVARNAVELLEVFKAALGLRDVRGVSQDIVYMVVGLYSNKIQVLEAALAHLWYIDLV